MKLLALDMDGVVFRGANFWLDFHHRMGTADAALDLWARHGTSDYARLGRLTAEIWKGRSTAEYFAMIRDRKYCDGVRELVAHAKTQGYRIALITSGAWHLADRAREELELNAVLANRLGVDLDGAFDGTVTIEVDDNFKGHALEAAQSGFGADRAGTVVIGDTKSDVQMAALAGTSIGFGVQDDAVRAAFDHIVEGASLEPAIKLLPAD